MALPSCLPASDPLLKAEVEKSGKNSISNWIAQQIPSWVKKFCSSIWISSLPFQWYRLECSLEGHPHNLYPFNWQNPQRAACAKHPRWKPSLPHANKRNPTTHGITQLSKKPRGIFPNRATALRHQVLPPFIAAWEEFRRDISKKIDQARISYFVINQI